MPMENTKTSMKKNYPIFLVCMGLFLFFQLSVLNSRLLEDRWYRDVMGVTPFDSVTLHTSTLTEGGIVISGEMRKVRCEYNSLIAYATFDDHPRQRAIIDDSAEGFEGSRPPSDETELWGPWTIHWEETIQPDGWEVFAQHVKCPNEPMEQVNLFLNGDWGNYILPED